MSTRSDVRVKREEHPLPRTPEAISSLVDSIVRGGSVQKIIIENGRPVRVYRNVVTEDEFEEQDMDIDAALRNAPMFEHSGEGRPLRILFELTQGLTEEKQRPVCFVSGQNSKGIVYQWLGIEKKSLVIGNEELFGIPLIRIRSLPEETLILCGSPYADAEPKDITLALKVTMEVHNESVDGDVGQGGSDSEGVAQGDEELENGGGGDGPVTWVPQSVDRGKS